MNGASSAQSPLWRPACLVRTSNAPAASTLCVARPDRFRRGLLAYLTRGPCVRGVALVVHAALRFLRFRALAAICLAVGDQAIKELGELTGCCPDGGADAQACPQPGRKLPSTLLQVSSACAARRNAFATRTRGLCWELQHGCRLMLAGAKVVQAAKCLSVANLAAKSGTRFPTRPSRRCWLPGRLLR